MIKNFVKFLELLGDRLEVCVSVFDGGHNWFVIQIIPRSQLLSDHFTTIYWLSNHCWRITIQIYSFIIVTYLAGGDL